MRLPLLVALSGLALFTACDDSFTFNTEGGTGPTTDGYCGVVQIFEADCYTCHSAQAPTNDLDLETDILSLIDQPSTYGALLLVSGDKDASLIYTKSAGTQTADEGGIMPLGSGLSAASLDILGAWIDDGTPEDTCAR